MGLHATPQGERAELVVLLGDVGRQQSCAVSHAALGHDAVATSAGFSINVEQDLDRLETADLIGVPAMSRHQDVPDEVVVALRRAHARGARILSVCSGAFTLGEAGLLDDRECTTRWRHTRELAERFPRASVVPEVLYVDAGQVITSAGTAAGLDATLHVWRQEYGAAVASAVARRMVVPPQRDGGQAQFIARAVPDCRAETLGPVLPWIIEHLGDELGADGFGFAATLRHHFSRVRGVSPHQYRRQLAC